MRIAGERILDSLRPGDLFDIVAFGDDQRVLFGRETPASAENIAHARRFVRRLDADMGGTGDTGRLPEAGARDRNGQRRTAHVAELEGIGRRRVAAGRRVL